MSCDDRSQEIFAEVLKASIFWIFAFLMLHYVTCLLIFNHSSPCERRVALLKEHAVYPLNSLNMSNPNGQ